MNFGTPLILITALASSLYLANQKFQTHQYKEDMKIAKRIDEKVKNIKDQVETNNLDNSNSIIVDDFSIIQNNKRISQLLVPGAKASKHDEILLDKHFRATVKYLKDSATSDKPVCSELVTTSLITLDECNYISAKDFEFFSYTNGAIQFNIPKRIASKVGALSKYNTVTTVDATTSKITNNDDFTTSKFMEQKIYDLTFKYNQLIDKQVEDSNIEQAKELNVKLGTFNPEASKANIVKYSW